MSQTQGGQTRKLRVLCVDDNDMLSEALGRRFARDSNVEWAGVVRDGREAYGRIREVMPDVVLMDIDMPGVDVFTIVERLASEEPSVRIVMFSGHINPDYIERALDCGAWGYLSKNDDIPALLEGLNLVARGELALSRDVERVRRGDWNAAGGMAL
jgi:DNA-binding NarL/FixJ family response regulator